MSYIVCFWDKSKLQVSDEVGIKLQEAKKSKSIENFELDSGLYSLSGVDKIITKDRAYEVFPTEFEYLQSLEDCLTSEDFIQLPPEKRKELNGN